MSSFIFLTLGERTVMVARPSTYQGFRVTVREQFPRISSVYNLAVVFQATSITGALLPNWVEVDETAYGAVQGGAELHINVRRTDGFGNRVGIEDVDLDATAGDNQVSTNRPREVSSRPRGASHKFDNSLLSLELDFPGGDAFGRGWGGASERFRRSAKLVPSLQDCKEAVGQVVGESNFYPEDEYEQTADFKLGTQQQQYQQDQPTEAGWHYGAESGPEGHANLGESEAQHLAGGQDDGDDEGKRNTFNFDDANRSWFAASPVLSSFQGNLSRNDRGRSPLTSQQWGVSGRAGQPWGGYRTPSPEKWVPYHDGGEKIPHYVRSRDCSPIDDGAGHWGSPQGGWNSPQNEMHVANQGYSRIADGQDGQSEAGHLTNGLTNGHTNGHTNGDTANGYPAAYSEVSHNSQHQNQHHGASDWSPPRPQSNGCRQVQNPLNQGNPYGPSVPPKAFAGRRPRHDPAEVTYGSHRPRIQGSATRWTTMGRKRDSRANNLVQELSDGEPDPNGHSQAWYGQLPPQYLNRTTGHEGASKHRGKMRHVSNTYQQKEGRGPAMSWGSDFWGGPPPNRTQRGASAQDDTPAKHW